METLRTDIRVAEQKTNDFKIIASDSIEDRASAFDIPASLKASFLCGLVDVSGAAIYLKRKKTSKKQVRVTLMHTATTKFEQLTMTHLNAETVTNKNIFHQTTGTHVIIGVLYGTQAFYVFESGVSSSDRKHEMQGQLRRELETAIRNMTASRLSWHRCHFEKAFKPDQFKLNDDCRTLYEDYVLKGKLSIHEQAASAVQSLPAFSDTSDESLVPIKVWLYPLKKFCPMLHIRSVLTEEVQAVMEELSDIDVQCEDLLHEPGAMHFPDIKSKIQKFRNLCQRYQLSFQKALSDALLSVRRRHKESALVDVLSARKQSPFNTEQITEYVGSLEKEVVFVSFCLNWLRAASAMNMFSSQQEMDHVLWDPRVEMVVSFTFTSLREEESHLLDLNHWLENMEETSHPTVKLPEPTKRSKKWFDDTDINQNTRAYMNEFIEFASGNIWSEKVQFIVSAIPDPGNLGASIYLYEKGVLKSSSFRPPRSDTPAINLVSHDSVQLTCAPCPDCSDQVMGYRVEYRAMRDHEYQSMRDHEYRSMRDHEYRSMRDHEYRSMRDNHWMIKGVTDTNRAFTVTGLLPNSLYQFRQSAVLARWVTRPGDPTAMIKTLPCRPPGKVNVLEQQPTSITLSWEEPVNIGAQVTNYKIEFLEKDTEQNTWTEVMTGKKTKTFAVQGLKSNVQYRFRVSAVCENAGSSFPSEECVFSTTAVGEQNIMGNKYRSTMGCEQNIMGNNNRSTMGYSQFDYETMYYDSP